MDLETLVSSVCAGGSDRKIACETLADPTNNGDDPLNHPAARPESLSVPPPDFPPESFFLSKEAEADWLNQNAFYERKDSQKGNSTSNSTNLNPNQNSSSQRISLKHKASIIGLPKPPKTCFNEAKNRRQHCKIANTRLFPKRVWSRGKTNPPLTEPSSPKVSCLGRVRSKRDRSRRINRQKSGRSNRIKENSSRVKKPGLFGSFIAIFRTGNCKDVSARGTHAPLTEASPRSVGTRKHGIGRRLHRDGVDATSAVADSPPRKSSGSTSRTSFESEPVGLTGLGGMKRFSSGRREDLLADFNVA